MEDERKGKKVNERSEKKKRRDKEEETFERKKRDDDDDEMCVYTYTHKSAWHRVRDTSRAFAALTFARFKMRRDSREECFLQLRE